MAEIGRPAKVLQSLELKDLVENKKKSRRIASKVYILSLCMAKEKDCSREEILCQKNNEENLEPEEVRERIGIYQERKMDKLLTYLNKEDYIGFTNSRPRRVDITEKGEVLHYFYVVSLKHRALTSIMKAENNLTKALMVENAEIYEEDTDEIEDEDRVDSILGLVDEENYELHKLVNRVLVDYVNAKTQFSANTIRQKLREAVNKSIAENRLDDNCPEPEEVEEIRSMMNYSDGGRLTGMSLFDNFTKEVGATEVEDFIDMVGGNGEEVLEEAVKSAVADLSEEELENLLRSNKKLRESVEEY